MFGNLKSLSHLLFSISCLGCGSEFGPVCRLCEENWNIPSTWSKLGDLPLIIGRKYNQEVQNFVLAAKETGSIHSRSVLARSIARSLESFLTYRSSQSGLQELDKTEVVIIAIPSRKSAIRRRGVDHGKTLAADVIDQLHDCQGSSKFESVEFLRHIRRIRDQSGLNPVERQQNLTGSLSVDLERIWEIKGRPVIVIDDVVTSGASIGEAIRALQVVGIRPLGAVVACASPIHFPIR